MSYYDADGKEVEGVLPPEEAEKLQAQIKELEEKSTQATELETKLKEKEEMLEKLSNKDYNFKKLREKTEEEMAELMKKGTEKEKMMMEAIMDLRKEREAEQMARYNESKEEILNYLSGGDESLRKAIEVAEGELTGKAVTPSELEARYRKAYILAKGEAPRPNPIFSGYSASYSNPDTKPKKFTQTDEGKASLKAWFPNIADRIIGEDKK